MRIRKIIYLFPLLLVLLISDVVVAQLPDYQVRKIYEQAGLKTNDIVSLTKDDEGYLWTATQNTVQQFDGTHTKTFLFDETLIQLFSHTNSNVFALSRQEVYIFNKATNLFKPLNLNIEGYLLKLIRTTQGAVFLVTNTSIYQIHITNGNLKAVLFWKKDKGTSAIQVATAGNEALFFADETEIYSLSTKNTLLQKIKHSYVTSIIYLYNNTLLLSTSRLKSHIIDFNENKLIPLHFKEPKEQKSHFYTGVHLNNKKILLASTSGFFEYNINTGEMYRPVIYANGKLLENQSSVESIYKDEHGDLFMNHVDGIYLYSASLNEIKYLRNYTDGNQQLISNNIRHITEDESGDIWLATNRGINKLNLQNGKIENPFAENTKEAFDYPSYRQVFNTTSHIWFGTAGKGIFIYNKTSKKISKPKIDEYQKEDQQKILDESYVWKILRLKNNNIFVATGKACYEISSQNFKAKKIPLPYTDFVSRSAMQDQQGNIWHGTANGLFCLNENYTEKFRITNLFSDGRIASLAAANSNCILVGTKGLYSIKLIAKNQYTLKQQKGIPANSLIYSIKKDLQGFYWLGTDEGIYKYDFEKDTAIYFNQTDNIQSQAFNSDAALLTSNGYILMGGKNGLNYFLPNKLNNNSTSLKVNIGSFSIEGRPVNIIDRLVPLQVSYNKRNISFTIAAPDFKTPFSLQYRYRLSEREEWVYTNNNSNITINQIKPGIYELFVAASHDGKKWYDSSAPILLNVKEPWWQMLWFKILIAILLLCIVLVVAKLRDAKRKQKEFNKTIEYFAQSTYTHSTVNDILWDITSNCVSRLGLEECVIYLVDKEGKTLIQKAAYGAKTSSPNTMQNPLVIEIGKGIVGSVAISKQAEIIADTRKDKRYIVDDVMRVSEITVPILHDGKVIGVIDSENTRRNFFKAKHLSALKQIATICAAKIASGMALEDLKQAKERLNELNRQLAEIKFSNLRLQMNPHFLFNSLTSIQHLIVSQQTKDAYRYLTTFSNFLRFILQFAEKTLISLEDEIGLLKMYIKLESLGFDESYTYDIYVEEELDQEEILIPPLLVQPFIENAIWHGLKNKQGNKFFSVKFEDDGKDSIVCTIYDNGIGREKAKEIQSQNLSAQSHQSKALSVTEKRLQLLQEKTGKPAHLQIKDEPQGGTSIIITIPHFNTGEL